jgi:hypothetical protein
MKVATLLTLSVSPQGAQGELLMRNERKNAFIGSSGEPVPRLETGERCPKCSKKRVYSERYDALFCASCNEWQEAACCTDPSCTYCAGRPEKPLIQASI